MGSAPPAVAAAAPCTPSSTSRCRAEPVRWIFAHAGIEFNEEIITMEEWPEKKKTLPYPFLPLLKFEGHSPLNQSLAIMRFAAREAGLVPEDSLTEARIDSMAETLFEVLSSFYKSILHSKDPVALEETLKKIYSEQVEPMAAKVEKKLSTSAWLTGDKMCWGDFVVAVAHGVLVTRYPQMSTAFPSIAKMAAKVEDLPGVKAYLAKRSPVFL